MGEYFPLDVVFEYNIYEKISITFLKKAVEIFYGLKTISSKTFLHKKYFSEIFIGNIFLA